MVAADFGCGSGGFTLPLAKELSDGLVYAIDIQEAPLSALKGRTLLQKTTNINVVRGDLEVVRGSTLPDVSVDMVIMANVLYQIEDRKAAFIEAYRILKEDGLLLIVDWLSDAPAGPADTKFRFVAEQATKLAQEHDLHLEKELESGAYHYALLFTKS